MPVTEKHPVQGGWKPLRPKTVPKAKMFGLGALIGFFWGAAR